jgi:hypothetical protein
MLRIERLSQGIAHGFHYGLPRGLGANQEADGSVSASHGGTAGRVVSGGFSFPSGIPIPAELGYAQQSAVYVGAASILRI